MLYKVLEENNKGLRGEARSIGVYQALLEHSTVRSPNENTESLAQQVFYAEGGKGPMRRWWWTCKVMDMHADSH